MAQQRGRGNVKPAIGIAFEGDVGSRIDAVLAIAMLNGFSAKGEARRITLGIPRASLKAAQLADVVSSFYSGRAIAGPGGGGVGGNPEGMIGMPEGKSFADDAPLLSAALAKKFPDGSPAYTSSVTRVLDTADNAVLIRNMLLAQVDGNANIVVAGPLSNIDRLLNLYGARPQIAAKVSLLVMAVGAFPGGPGGTVDPSIKADVAAARKVLAGWPTPIVAVGTEVGEALPYPAASIEADFAWATNHPVIDAYRVFKSMPYDAPASALAAMLHAVHPDDAGFKRSEPGTITVLDDGRTQFTPGADGKHHYLIVDPAQKDRVIKLYRDMVSAQPAPRPGRGGRGAAAAAAPDAAAQQQQQQQQQRPAAPEPPKPAVPEPPDQ